MNVLNDVTAPQFLVSFLQLAAEKKTLKMVQLEKFPALLILLQLQYFLEISMEFNLKN